ncbi:MAG: hypothetical protein AABW45_00990 [Nanoarchaeota archaeon]
MKIRKPGVDADGVLRNFHDRLREVYLKYYPNHQVPTIDKFQKDGLQHYFPIGDNIRKFFSEEHPKEIYLGAYPYPGASDFMDELRYLCNEVVIVTNQPNDLAKQLTKEWFVREKIRYDRILFTKDKSEFEGDYLLDDRVPELENILRGKKSVPVCFNQPWNQDWKGLRVYNYQEFLDIVRNHHSN